MKQIGRNLTDGFDGFLLDVAYLILDRDPLYTDAFRNLLKQAGVKVVRLPPRSPNLNAYAERFVRTIKESCLDRMIFFSADSLRRAINEFLIFYHHERNHQGLENRLIDPLDRIGFLEGKVACRERLGGVLRFYHRRAAWNMFPRIRIRQLRLDPSALTSQQVHRAAIRSVQHQVGLCPDRRSYRSAFQNVAWAE